MQQVALIGPSGPFLGSNLSKTIEPTSNNSYSFELVSASAETISNAEGSPFWVDESYLFDSSNPRKPNMRELIEALSGRQVEDLYADPESNWQEFSRKASDILYGVLGGASDNRDWEKIMSSVDIVEAASDETAVLHNPYVDIESTYETFKLADGTVSEVLTAQFPVLRSNNETVLTTGLSSNSANTIDELNRFGGKRIHFRNSIFDKIEIANFDFASLQVIRDYLEGKS